jgi:hypothetical protein
LESIAATLVRILTTKLRAGKWAVKHKQSWEAHLVPKKINTLSFYTDCFQAGECKGSVFITGEQKSDEFECLDFCKSGSFLDFSNLTLPNLTLPNLT